MTLMLSPFANATSGDALPTPGAIPSIDPFGALQSAGLDTSGISGTPQGASTQQTDTGGGGTGGGGGGTTSSGPSYAQIQASILQDIANQRDLAHSQATTSIGTAANDVGAETQGFILQNKAAQTAINRAAIQNELSKIQGNRGVLDMVGTGMKSGGVQLANMNASNSSAADALARAYGILGRQQMTGVGNQYAKGQNDIANRESDLEQTMIGQNVQVQKDKIDSINNIVTNAQAALAVLNQRAATYSLPAQVDVEAEKENIRQQALAALAQYDDAINQGKVAPTAQADNQAEAFKMANAGVAPANAFDYSTIAPPEAQNGPSPAQLPIYTNTFAKKQAA